jgi:hypothetical protein
MGPAVRSQIVSRPASASGSACARSVNSLVSVPPLIAARSKIVTGALLWLRPTTSTLTCPPSRAT